MKKISTLILSSFVTALFFSAAPAAYAKNHREKDKIKIYYSESIGAGDKVYHLTACQKTQAYAPLKCSKPLADSNANYKKQCEPKGKLTEGKLVKGCIELSQNDPTLPYPKVFVQTYNVDNTCANKPDNVSSEYGPIFAFVSKKGIDGEDLPENEWEIKEKAVWPAGKGKPPAEAFSKDNRDKLNDADVVSMYQSSLCVTWDVFAKEPGKSEAQGELTGEEVALFSKGRNLGKRLIDAGCNNDNSSQKITNKISTPFNDEISISCSVKERIVGSSGSDIFGQYIGALYKWASGIVGVIAVLTMVYSGIQISMAQGDSAKLDSAKQRIMQSLIGMALLFLSGLILYTINPGFFAG